MDEFENTVDMMQETADDAQTGEEISLNDLMDNLTDGAEAEETDETAEQTGGSDPETQTQTQTQTEGKDKFGRRIASALANQKRGFQKDLDFSAKVHGAAGDMTEEEITEALRDYQARKIAESDKEISPKAARKIVEAQEKANRQPTDARSGELQADVQSLYNDGWTLEELQALTTDEQVRRQVNSEGMSLRKAAKMYLQRQTAQTTTKRRSVPTAKSAGSGAPPDDNPIANMTDAEFDAFQERVERAAMEGKRVKL